MIWRSSFRTRGVATPKNMLMSIVTESSEQWQCSACMPTPIQERVAKLVDSAQLKPWLKPQWYAPVTGQLPGLSRQQGSPLVGHNDHSHGLGRILMSSKDHVGHTWQVYHEFARVLNHAHDWDILPLQEIRRHQQLLQQRAARGAQLVTHSPPPCSAASAAHIHLGLSDTQI